MSTGIQIHAQGARAGIREARAASRAEVTAAVFRAGAYAQTVVRAAASTGTHPPRRPHIPGTGPGPNVATGDYRRGIDQENDVSADVATSEVGTDAVQALRLEHGFIGQDSAGRYFRAPAYPHFAPALPVVQKYADDEIDKAAGKIEAAFGGTGG